MGTKSEYLKLIRILMTKAKNDTDLTIEERVELMSEIEDLADDYGTDLEKQENHDDAEFRRGERDEEGFGSEDQGDDDDTDDKS